MHNVTPITLTMIVRNEEHNLRACLESVRPYVQTIVIVDTGSIDKTPEIAREFADLFEVWTECNDESGNIASFSEARNRALSHVVSGSVVLWMDGDDLLRYPEELQTVIQKYQTSRSPFAIHLPYEVDDGKLTYPRVRIFSYDRNARLRPAWNLPVHEDIDFSPETDHHTESRPIVVHKPSPNKIRNPHRNLEILQKAAKIHSLVARERYYLGRELLEKKQIEAGVDWLFRYLEVATWEDEKCSALLRIAEASLWVRDFDRAIRTAAHAHALKPAWKEPFFLLGEIHYTRMQEQYAQTKEDAERTIFFLTEWEKRPETDTRVILDVKPRMERAVPRYLQMAQFKLGQVSQAVQTVAKGLEKNPSDPWLLESRDFYQREGL